MTASSDARATNATIGLYSDSNGYSCSFSGNNSGPLTAYVVIKPGTSGITGARFAAPVPSCFDAVFLSESTPPGVASIGSSQIGISVSSGSCETAPFQVLQITYLASTGTSPCCGYPIIADPQTGLLEATNCAFQSTAISTITSRFNADASCACGTAPPTYLPPAAPFNPYPADQAADVYVETQLRWQCSDPNGLGFVCDLYLGTDPNPPLVATNIPTAGSALYTPGHLVSSATYFWRVVVRNDAQLETSGPVWSFLTSGNSPPSIGDLQPFDGTTMNPLTPNLYWHAVDPDHDPMTFDIYLGNSSSPPLVAGGLTSQQYAVAPGMLSFSTKYWWRVVVHDGNQHDVSSVQQSFTTKAQNEPPTGVFFPNPADAATGVGLNPTLSWSGIDPENQPLAYDVYFGQKESWPYATIGLYADRYGSSCSLSGNSTGLVDVYVVVVPGTTQIRQVGFTVSIPACFNATYVSEQVTSGYNWQGNSQTGLTAYPPSCTTSLFSPLKITYLSNGATPCCLMMVGPFPEAGHIVAKTCNLTDTPIVATNSWLNAGGICGTCSAYDLPRVAHDVFLPASYFPGQLTMQTTYLWRIVARDPGGLETSSPFWSFTTRGNTPPNPPTVVSPANGASNVALNATLAWNCTDPDAQALTYDVYFGKTTTPPLVAQNVPTPSYDPGLMSAGSTYRWRVVARDPAGLTTTGNTWSFVTSTDGNLPPAVPSNPNPPSSATVSTNPVLTWSASDPENDPLTFHVVVEPGPITGDVPVNEFRPGPLPPGRFFSWHVEASDGHWTTAGPTWYFTTSGGGGELPVLFSRFDAKVAGVGAQLSWKLASDEPMEIFTLYRRVGNEGAVVVAQGRVTGNTGSYLDNSVAAGTTYRYELMIRTTDGDEFRSPAATVTLPSLDLTLYQNSPNPFNPETTIRYDLPAGSTHVRLLVADLGGRRVRTLVDETQSGGARSVVWNGRDDSGQAVSSGVYFYVLDAGKQRLTRKLVLLK